MSPNDTKLLIDVHPLPPCAPDLLKDLYKAAEAIIQEQLHMLGSGTPSKAPNLQKLLNGKGFSDPTDESKMIDDYKGKKAEMHAATSKIKWDDNGIELDTENIGGAVTGAYKSIQGAVDDLNTKHIDPSFKAVQKVEIHDDKGSKKFKDELPPKIVDELFKAVWETLNTTFEKSHGVSDAAAKAALKIKQNPPGGPPPDGNIPPAPNLPSAPGVTQTGYHGGSAGGGGSESSGPAIIPSGDKPTAMAMMEYLIKKHHFTPAQAAGIVANAKFESGFDVGATGDNGSAKGLFQWRFNRLAGLEDFAKEIDPATGKPRGRGDWHTHIDYMVKELRGGGYQAADAAVSANPTDAGEVAKGFDRNYEKSAGLSTGQRESYADGLLLEYNKSQSSVAV